MAIKTLILSKPVIAITGSAGKTTTKEMIASILKRRWNVFKSIGNFNNSWNTYKYSKEIKPEHDVVVLEYGMGGIGSGRKHCRYILPNIGVITSIGTAHIGNVGGTLEGVIRAKSELVQYMKQTGTLFLNADDPNTKRLALNHFKGKIVTIGIKSKANLQATHVEYLKNGMRFRVNFGGYSHSFTIPCFGIANVYNALLAIAVARHLGISLEDIQKGLESFTKPPRRLQLIRLPRQIHFIDDSHNANPHAMKEAIDVLMKIGNDRKIAVLGSMHDLGDYSLRGHMEVGSYAASKPMDYLFTYGKEANWIARGAIEAGFPSWKIKHFMSKKALVRELLKSVTPNSTVLIKGSNKMNMSSIVKSFRNQKKGAKKS